MQPRRKARQSKIGERQRCESVPSKYSRFVEIEAAARAAENNHDGARFATWRNEEPARGAFFICVFASIENSRAWSQPAPVEFARCNCLIGDFRRDCDGIGC